MLSTAKNILDKITSGVVTGTLFSEGVCWSLMPFVGTHSNLVQLGHHIGVLDLDLEPIRFCFILKALCLFCDRW